MEVRIFDRADSVRGEPIAIAPVGPDGTATWSPPLDWFASPMREMKFVLRAYDEQGRFEIRYAGEFEQLALRAAKRGFATTVIENVSRGATDLRIALEP